ncbi:MAG: phosphoadenylyl-sulfate reductase [Nitrospiria bacterium]
MNTTSTLLTRQQLDGENTRYRNQSPETVLKWALEEFGSAMTLACSFGAEDVVLVDMLAKLTPSPRIFCLDTGRLHSETYEVMDAIRDRYGVAIETYFPRHDAVEQMVRAKGANLFYQSVENRKECCGIRKVEPLGRALDGMRAWITGLRSAQAVTRAEMPMIEIDTAHGGMAKINPLINWTESEVWDYIKLHKVPYNRLHDQGFPSIGCAPCTRAVKPGEDVRAGRWWWESPEHKECGLHSRAGAPAQ